jgi:putative two-component system response regulator
MRRKRLLITDDSDIDREILKNILCDTYDIIEASNGFESMQSILSNRGRLDAILLDISMPIIDGFNVLEFMDENRINNVPVILITADASKTNVYKAFRHNITNFIKKPYNPDTVMEKLSTIFDDDLNVMEESPYLHHMYDESDLAETIHFISHLTRIYNQYLKNYRKDDKKYTRISKVMHLLLEQYVHFFDITDLSDAHIDMISQAAYFYDIGQMGVPDVIFTKPPKTKAAAEAYESHTTIGADIICLNHSESCQYFVEICEDMCLHHHERIDGRGYPHGLNGDENAVYTQLCTISIKFDEKFSEVPEKTSEQFERVVNVMASNSGEFSSHLIPLLDACKTSILEYYNS